MPAQGQSELSLIQHLPLNFLPGPTLRGKGDVCGLYTNNTGCWAAGAALLQQCCLPAERHWCRALRLESAGCWCVLILLDFLPGV